MKTELFRVIKEIDFTKLANSDKDDLLQIFLVVKNTSIRDRIAFIFSDLHYNQAIPSILKKINESESYNNNGSLVYALDGLDVEKYMIDVVKIICTMDYEARLGAFELVQKYVATMDKTTKGKCLAILREQGIKEKQRNSESGENSRLHFIEQTEKLLSLE